MTLSTQSTHWRFSQQPVRLWFVDYRACFLLLLMVMHCRLWTLGLCGVGIVVLAFLEYRGLTVLMALSRLRYGLLVFVAGRQRPGSHRLKSQRLLKGAEIFNEMIL